MYRRIGVEDDALFAREGLRGASERAGSTRGQVLWLPGNTQRELGKKDADRSGLSYANICTMIQLD